MRLLLRCAAAMVLLLGIALWFFGGMNMGPSQWTEDSNATSPEHRVAEERRHVFRPGLSFLIGAAGIAAMFISASLALPRRPDSPNP